MTLVADARSAQLDPTYFRRLRRGRPREPLRPRELRKRYEDGPATITLVTCTPLGVNTHRLLVTGVREPIPARIAAASTQRDGRLIAAGAALGVFAALLVAANTFSRIRAKRRGRRPKTPDATAK